MANGIPRLVRASRAALAARQRSRRPYSQPETEPTLIVFSFEFLKVRLDYRAELLLMVL